MNALVFFRAMKKPENSGRSNGNGFSLFLAGTEEPFTVHATAS